MKLKLRFHKTPAAMVVAGFLSVAAGSGHAGALLSLQSASGAPGSTGNQFDVLLTNTGPSTLSVGAFTFSISVTNPSIVFTGATTTTAATYVFGANSLFGPDLTGAVSSQTLAASDLFSTPAAGATVGSGVTVGLGRVSFLIAAGATPGVFPVSFAAFPASSLSDPNAQNIAIGSLNSGSITITGSGPPVPEPSTIWLIVVPLGACLLRRARLAAAS
jgi:hypothetical protein